MGLDEGGVRVRNVLTRIRCVGRWLSNPEFAKRVTSLFDYIETAIDDRNAVSASVSQYVNVHTYVHTPIHPHIYIQ